MSENAYATLSILGMFLIIIPAMLMPETLKLLTGILMGTGLSMSAFATVKLLVNFEGKVEG